jgi:hypothetical protein
MRRLLRRTPGLAVAAAADQALSSGTNVLTLLVGARVLAPDRFGAVVVALGAAMVAVTAQRALVGDTLLACAAAAPEEAQRRMSRDALATAGAIGLAGAAAGMALGALPYRLLADLGWMAVWLPAVCLQDGYRYRFFCARRPDLALRADAGWAAVQGAVLLAALLGGHGSRVIAFALLAFVGGFLTLVFRMKDRPPIEDTPDDGAVV